MPHHTDNITTMETKERDRLENARRNGQAHIEGICDAYTAWSWLTNDSREGNDLTPGARRVLRELEWDGESFDDAAQAIEDEVREQALSCELLGSWTPGETPEAEGWRILLTTGGPAFRLVGTLNQWGEPATVKAEAQDWFTPWTEQDTTSEEDEALLWFACRFYWGEA